MLLCIYLILLKLGRDIIVVVDIIDTVTDRGIGIGLVAMEDTEDMVDMVDSPVPGKYLHCNTIFFIDARSVTEKTNRFVLFLWPVNAHILQLFL